MLVRALVMVLLVTGGCGKTASKKAASEASGEPASEGSSRDAGDSTSEVTVGADQAPKSPLPPTIAQLPATSFAPAIDFASASPTELVKRNDLAIAHLRKGDKNRALALLVEIARAGCDACQAVVDDALSSDAWRELWFDPRFVEIALMGMPGEDEAVPIPELWSTPVDMGFDPDWQEWWDSAGPGCPEGTQPRAKLGAHPGSPGEIYCARGKRKHGPYVAASFTNADVDVAEFVITAGNYRDGLREGWWWLQEWRSQGTLGRYVAGKKHGPWLVKLGGRERLEIYRRGQAHGPRYDTGPESGWVNATRAINRNGKLHGPYLAYHSNGAVAESGEYVAGKKHGGWKYFRSDGSVWAEKGYRAGVRQGPFVYRDARGAELGRVELAGDSGPWIAFNEAGELLEKGAFERGIAVGPWTHYGRESYEVDEMSGSYRAGKRDGEWAFKDEGREYARGTYVNAVPHGSWKVTNSDATRTQTLEFSKGKLVKVDGRAATKQEISNYEEARNVEFPFFVDAEPEY